MADPLPLALHETPLRDRHVAAGARLIDTIARNLKDETYRRDPRVWELRDDRGEELQSVVEPMLSTQTARPYFELLVVSHSTQLSEEAQRRDRHALRREDDPFLYETVRVGSYADAVVAALPGRWFWWPQQVRTRPASALLRPVGSRSLVRSLMLRDEPRPHEH